MPPHRLPGHQLRRRRGPCGILRQYHGEFLPGSEYYRQPDADTGRCRDVPGDDHCFGDGHAIAGAAHRRFHRPEHRIDGIRVAPWSTNQSLARISRLAKILVQSRGDCIRWLRTVGGGSHCHVLVHTARCVSESARPSPPPTTMAADTAPIRFRKLRRVSFFVGLSKLVQRIIVLLAVLTQDFTTGKSCAIVAEL